MEISSHFVRDSELFIPDSRRAWARLAVAVVIGALGSVGMWSVVVALPEVQGAFGASRGTASLAYTVAMLGFGSGGVLTGKITDRYGIVAAIGLGIGFLALGYIGAGMSSSVWQFILMHFAIGLSSSATFGPLMAEASHWFERHRGLAVTIAASGSYIGGTIWPPVMNWGMEAVGWRDTHIAVGIFTALAMTLALVALRLLMGPAARRSHVNAPPPRVDLRLSANTLTVMLSLASVACCVAMSMPQVHIVAYCGDLGYGVARGAEMLSLMLGFGIVSRIGSGFLADRIGGIRTLLIGSVAQGFALLFYLFFDSLTSLYVISAMFGLFQGGIVPLCHHRARSDAGTGGGDPRRHRHLRLRVRHVVRRLDLRRDLRCHRLLRRGVPERAGVERAQHHHHGVAVDQIARATGNGLDPRFRAKRIAVCVRKTLAHEQQQSAADHQRPGAGGSEQDPEPSVLRPESDAVDKSPGDTQQQDR